MSGALACKPTRELRDELEAAGVELPGHTELRELSRDLNEWLEAARPKEGKASSYTFFNLFCVRAASAATGHTAADSALLLACRARA